MTADHRTAGTAAVPGSVRADRGDTGPTATLVAPPLDRHGQVPAGVTPGLSVERLPVTAWLERLREVGRSEAAALADLFAGPRLDNGRVALTLLIERPDRAAWLALRVAIDPGPGYPSLVAGVPAAEWYEREILDTFGVLPVGHPHPWSLGYGPADQAVGNPARPVQPALASASLVDYPLGPVRSGIVESGQYRIRTVGEEIVDLQLKLTYKHRGVEQLLAGVAWPLAPRIAERISGTDAVAHALASAQALERLAGLDPSIRASTLRSLFAELERLHNHVGFQADLCGATGLAVAQAQFDLLRERLLRLNARIAGHRYLFGTIVAGGVADDLDDAALTDVAATISDLRRSLAELGPLLRGSSSHLDRLQTTGRLAFAEAADLSVVGPVARASGLDVDVRRDHPYAAYESFRPAVPVHDGGDAAARSMVRLQEAMISADLVLDLADGLLAGGPLPGQTGPVEARLQPDAVGLGWAESARGAELHWVETNSRGEIARYRVRSASFACWQAFARCVPRDNILTDFPIIEQSFGLSIAGSDR
jgi:Ni,Fe-hydrogenase III large subunit